MTRIFEALRRHRQEAGEGNEAVPGPDAPGLEPEDYDDQELPSGIGARSEGHRGAEGVAPAPPAVAGAHGLAGSAFRLQPLLLHPRLIMMTEPLAPECEQFRTLRTQVFHSAEKKGLKVLTVTSAIAGEGKTSTVINLAIAIAQSREKRVLLIDGDLRRPNIAAYLGLRRESGLGELLNSASELKDSIVAIEGLGLDILPARGETENPTEALSSNKLAITLASLRDCYDYILIDTPPVIPFADARLLANHSDGVILVVRAGMAGGEVIEKAIESLPQGRILGVVLNGAEMIGESGYYDYYYNYAGTEKRRRVLEGIRRSFIGRIMRL